MGHTLANVSVKDKYKLVEDPQLNRTKMYLYPTACKITAWYQQIPMRNLLPAQGRDREPGGKQIQNKVKYNNEGIK